jgi:hypothetical protein
MLKVNLIVAGLLAIANFSGNAFAKAPSELNGMWILDAAATEQLYLGASRPSNANAKDFTAGHWLCLISHRFSEDKLIVGAFGGRGKETEYRLLSEDGSKFTYTQTGATASQSESIRVSMSMLKGESLEIVVPSLMKLPTIWKKVTNERVTSDDACIKSMGRIFNFLKEKAN